MHWRKYFDERFIGSWDFEGRPNITVTMKEIVIEELSDEKGRKEHRPALYFVDKKQKDGKSKKGLVLNKTNARTIAELYGTDTDEWKGKRITLFATQCQAFGKTVDCVRVRNEVPRSRGQTTPQQEPPESPSEEFNLEPDPNEQQTTEDVPV